MNSMLPLHALNTYVGIYTENFSKDIETIASKEREPGTQGVRETSYLLGIVLDCLTLLNAIKKFQNIRSFCSQKHFTLTCTHICSCLEKSVIIGTNQQHC